MKYPFPRPSTSALCRCPPLTPASASAALPRRLRPQRPHRQRPLRSLQLFSSSASRFDSTGSREATSNYTPRQVYPRGAYYDVLLVAPPPYPITTLEEQTVTAAEPDIPATNDASTAAAPTPDPTPQERARIVFGSRLAGPIERANRLAELRERSTRIAGVLVPPRPDEPDNCCMSGCVNCVWDRFRDEMEAWAAASAEAGRRLVAQEGGASSNSSNIDRSVSMDDDGGGSESNWSPEQMAAINNSSGKIASSWAEELYKDVPVGIREFMRQEKRLKLRHIQEGTVGG